MQSFLHCQDMMKKFDCRINSSGNGWISNNGSCIILDVQEEKMDIKGILHKKRATTEEHIKILQQEGREGIRYTAMMPDIPFLIFALLCDIGWIIHLISGIIYFCTNGFRNILDGMALIALLVVVFGILYTIYMNKIHEKEIATKLQKNMSFGLTVYGGLAGGIIGMFQLANITDIPGAIIWMTIGGFLNFVTGLPIYLSFKKGIIYSVQ